MKKRGKSYVLAKVWCIDYIVYLKVINLFFTIYLYIVPLAIQRICLLNGSR